MSSLYSKIKSFFHTFQKSEDIKQLYRLESVPNRPLERIENCVFNCFNCPNNQIQQKIDYLMSRVQSDHNFKSIITYLVLFKDIVCLGPETVSQCFIAYKLKFDSHKALVFFYNYTVKVAYNHELYASCLKAYNSGRENKEALTLKPNIILAYKALNLLNELITGLTTILKNVDPLFQRLSLSLISDCILYFVYIKQSIFYFEKNLAQFQNTQVLGFIDQFLKVNAGFRKMLFDYRVDNRYYKADEQKRVNLLKRALLEKMADRQQQDHTIMALTERDCNRKDRSELQKSSTPRLTNRYGGGYVPSTKGDDFSFGIKAAVLQKFQEAP